MSRKQNIRPVNDKGQTHGLWTHYYDDGNLWFKERYVNGIKHGIDEIYHYNGDLLLKNYDSNNKTLYSEYYEGINGINRIRFNI